jgi:hypothetical protein
LVRDEGGLWHLLRGLEAHGVHNVQVTPVTPEAEAVITGDAAATETPQPPSVPMLTARAPVKRKPRGGPGLPKDTRSRNMILQHMSDQPMRPVDIALKVGMDPKRVNNFLTIMLREGMVERPEFGLYVIVRRHVGAPQS